MTQTTVRSVPFARPWISDADRDAVQRVLAGHILTHGPEGKAFEAEFGAFLGDGAHCVTVSSCMAALHLSCLEFKFGPVDEVIVPAQTHAATVHAVEWVGATPVFVDPEPGTGNMTAAAIAAAVTPRTKGIIVVHFAGIPCDMRAIAALSAERHLTLIEDCALAVGSRWNGRHVGLYGDAGCFSFYPVKHITTAEGGMFVTRHADVAERVARLRAFGVDRSHGERSVPGMYDVPSLGLNYRMSELQAALGRTQLARIHENLARRRANFARMRDAVDGIPAVRLLDAAHADATSSHYCATLLLGGAMAPRRTAVMAALTEAGVGTSIYYPHPVPRMIYYRTKYGYDENRFHQAAAISDASIALPVGPHLDEADVDHVATIVRATLRAVQQ